MTLRALQKYPGSGLRSSSLLSPRCLALLPSLRTACRTYLRNASIPVEKAMLVDRETQKLTGPFSLETILAGRARAENGRWLEAAELVTETPEPIVKYINIREEYMRAKAQHQKDRENAKARKTKEIQLTFQTADSDMAHKLKKAREALEQRSKVTITYSNKKGAARLQENDINAKLAKTVELLADVGKESKPHTILPNGMAVIYLEPSSSK